MLQQTANEAATQKQALEKKLQLLAEELERERNRTARDDPSLDPYELRRRCHNLEDQLETALSLNSSLRYQLIEVHRFADELKERKEFYKSQYQWRMASVVHETIDYWRNRYYELEYDQKRLKKKIQDLEDRQTIADTIWRVIWCSARMEKILTNLIDHLIPESSLRKELLKPGLLTKLRYMGEFCFMHTNSKRPTNDQLYFYHFIKDWDEDARKFCQTRNKVCHEFEYLETLSNEMRLEVALEYDAQYKSLLLELESLQNAVESRDKPWMQSAFPNQEQKINRLKDLRLPSD